MADQFSNHTIWLEIAEDRAQAHLAAYASRRKRPNGIKIQTGRLLNQVGYRLVEWGEQMEGTSSSELSMPDGPCLAC